MLESEIDYEEPDREDQRGDHDEQCRTLQLVPGRPSDLLGQLDVTLFQIVNELSHLCI